MKKIVYLLSIGILLSMLALSCSTAKSSANDADAREITELLAAYDRARNSGDLEGVMTAWADDAVLIPPDQPPIVGKAAINDVIRGWLVDHCTSKHEPLHTQSFGEVVINRGTTTGECTPRGSPSTSFSVNYLAVFRRQSDGSLRYWRVMANNDTPVR
jgi:uncharacterized protein (TIGR02246 family)